jgi:hypothetical protein
MFAQVQLASSFKNGIHNANNVLLDDYMFEKIRFTAETDFAHNYKLQTVIIHVAFVKSQPFTKVIIKKWRKIINDYHYIMNSQSTACMHDLLSLYNE